MSLYKVLHRLLMWCPSGDAFTWHFAPHTAAPWLGLVLLLSLYPPGQAQGQGWVHADTLVFPTEYLLGSVRSIAVSDEGLLALTDPTAREAVVVDFTADRVTQMDPAGCDPGAVMAPKRVYWISSTALLVTSGNAPWGYVFEPNGNCVRALSHRFRPDDSLCVSPDGIWALNIDGPESTVITRYDLQGEPQATSATLPNRFPNLNNRKDFSGLVCAGRSLYLVYASGYAIYELDARTLVLKRSIGEQPRGHRQLDSDVAHSSDISEIMMSMRAANATSSMTTAAFEFSPGVLLLEYMNGGAEFIDQIVDLRADPPRYSSWLSSRGIIHAKAGHAYGLVVVPGEDNPGILVKALNSR